MAAIARVPKSEWKGLTYRELCVIYQVTLLDKWNHTAVIACQIYNLQAIVINALGGKDRKLQIKNYTDFHPYLKSKHKGMKITRANITDLKLIGNALCQ